jgi:hypothetical protein
MKKLCIAFIIAAFAGCHGPATTEINRPSPDVNGTWQLVLKTMPEDQGEETFASAAYSDGTAQGFGPGILITCNSFPIVDTRNGISVADTGRFIETSAIGIYEWAYSGPDTSFVLDMPTHSGLTIISPREDSEIILDSLFGGGGAADTSLIINYEPAGPCTNLQVILTDEEQTIIPVTQFNPSTGIIAPISLKSLNLTEGDGTISISIRSDSAFSISTIHSIIVEDSVVSLPSSVFWL